MKKKLFSLVSILCIALSLCFVLTGCQLNVNPEGAYHVKSVSVTIAGTTSTMDYETYTSLKEDTSSIQDVMTFAIFSAYFETGLKIYYGGTAEMINTVNGATQTSTASWSQDGDKITLTSTSDPDETMTLAINGTELSMTENTNPQIPVYVVWEKE